MVYARERLKARKLMQVQGLGEEKAYDSASTSEIGEIH